MPAPAQRDISFKDVLPCHLHWTLRGAFGFEGWPVRIQPIRERAPVKGLGLPQASRRSEQSGPGGFACFQEITSGAARKRNRCFK
jgi:hypothetical protein